MKKQRLTQKNGIGGAELIICMSCDPGEGGNVCGVCDHFQRAIDRLLEYEETGLMPEDVKKLAKGQKK